MQIKEQSISLFLCKCMHLYMFYAYAFIMEPYMFINLYIIQIANINMGLWVCHGHGV